MTFLFSGMIFLACGELASEPKDGDGIKGIDVSGEFEFGTLKDVTGNFSAINTTGGPLIGIRFNIRMSGPNNSGSNGTLIHTGVTESDGNFSPTFQAPVDAESLFIQVQYVGALNAKTVPIINNEVSFTFDLRPPPLAPQRNAAAGFDFKSHLMNPSYIWLGTWDNHGIPFYLESIRDILSQSLLDDINASIPESAPIPLSHPEYLAVGNQTNVSILDSCNLWITFVHEGAGWKNAIGYYTYDVNNPPTQASDVDSITIIYPNLSYQGGGGGLYSGDKIFLGSFPKDTVVGWALVAQGWNQGLSTVDDGIHIVYSDPALNPESDSELQQHNVLLFDSERGLVLIGFEDILRDSPSCDNDFNDAVFYITASDINCIDDEDTIPIGTPPGADCDLDGITDDIDDFPCDPLYAFCVGVPAVDAYGTLAFEDGWPTAGDYDYNDLILDYNLKQLINADNLVVEMHFSFIIRAVGTPNENGFAIELPIPSSDTASVTGTSLTANYISLEANGTEAGHSGNAVVVVYDNIRGHMGFSDESLMNTERGVAPLAYDTTTVKVVFTTPLDPNSLNGGPYNPFLIIDQDRTREVHFKNSTPTDLADATLFGTEDDASIPGSGLYYQSSNGIPWVVSTPIQMDYPFEGVDITTAHLLFAVWAQSGGTLSNNWYLDNPAFRVRDNIYRPFGISNR